MLVHMLAPPRKLEKCGAVWCVLVYIFGAALGVTLSLMCISTGGPDIHGSGLWGQVLKVDDPNSFNSQSFILTLFSGMQVNGRALGRSGTTDRGGHEHGASVVSDA